MNDKIAIYLRLSLADGDLKKGSKDESNSIENQRMLLHDYIGKQEDLFGEIVEYVDDGYTGTNFNRPAFQKMIVDLKQGNIKVIMLLMMAARSGILPNTYARILLRSPEKSGSIDLSTRGIRAASTIHTIFASIASNAERPTCAISF